MKNGAVLRCATFEDVEEMREVELSCWDDCTPRATAEQFKDRIKAFPEGQWVATIGDRIMGLANTMIVAGYDMSNPTPTWDLVTNGGRILGAHDYDGDILYGVNLSCRPEAPKGIATMFLLRAGMMVIERGLKACVLGGRMPDYHLHQERYTPEEYLVAKNSDGSYLDSQLRFYHQVKGMSIAGLLPGYMPDPESCDIGVLLIWRNPFLHFPRFMHRPLSKLMSFLV